MTKPIYQLKRNYDNIIAGGEEFYPAITIKKTVNGTS